LGFREQHQPSAFIQFLIEKSQTTDHIIIAGDFMELWRRDLCGCIIENYLVIATLKEISEHCQVHLVSGNHDYHLQVMGLPMLYELPFRWHDQMILEEGETKFIVEHGHRFDFSCSNKYLNNNMCSTDDLAGEQTTLAWETFLDKVSKSEPLFQKMMVEMKEFWDINAYFKGQQTLEHLHIPKEYQQIMERFRVVGVYDPNQSEEITQNALNSLKKNEYMIIGHTHVPFVRERIANSGCWIRGMKSYIHIHDGTIELKDYNEEI
tara:strand:+ start:381 stop:1172 length:792 start_codon:yes stop_codon:yes gene_type:complete